MSGNSYSGSGIEELGVVREVIVPKRKLGKVTQERPRSQNAVVQGGPEDCW